MRTTLLSGARAITMADGKADVEELDVPFQDDRIAEVGPHHTWRRSGLAALHKLPWRARSVQSR